MSAGRSDLMRNVTTINVGTQSASIALPGLVFPQHSRIKSVSYVNQAALSADNTNYLGIQVQDNAQSPNNLATLDTRAANQGALTANVPIAMAINTSAPQIVTPHNELDMIAGSWCVINVVKHGTGAPTLGQIQIEWYPV